MYIKENNFLFLLKLSIYILYMNFRKSTYNSEQVIDVPIYGYLPQTFYVSRHLNSCNNMVDDVKWTNATYKFSEPPLSMWGVISGLEPYKINKFREMNRVYVSCLVRTWMTAIIEYLPY